MLSLLRLECKQNNSPKPFRIRISFFFSYSFGIETILRSYNPVLLWKTIPDSRQKWAKTTKTAQKPYPIGPPKPNYSLYKGVPPPRVFSYPQSHRILYWIKSEERMKMFAGTDTEGSRDGLASPAKFCKPAGLCVACEQQAHFRSSLLSLRKIGGREAKTGNASTVRRLGFVWNLTMFCICVMPNQLYWYSHSAWNRFISTRSRKAFSFHEEHAKYELCNLQGCRYTA